MVEREQRRAHRQQLAGGGRDERLAGILLPQHRAGLGIEHDPTERAQTGVGERARQRGADAGLLGQRRAPAEGFERRIELDRRGRVRDLRLRQGVDQCRTEGDACPEQHDHAHCDRDEHPATSPRLLGLGRLGLRRVRAHRRLRRWGGRRLVRGNPLRLRPRCGQPGEILRRRGFGGRNTGQARRRHGLRPDALRLSPRRSQARECVRRRGRGRWC